MFIAHGQSRRFVEAFACVKTALASARNPWAVVPRRAIDRRSNIDRSRKLSIDVVADVQIRTAKAVLAAETSHEQVTLIRCDQRLKGIDIRSVDLRSNFFRR